MHVRAALEQSASCVLFSLFSSTVYVSAKIVCTLAITALRPLFAGRGHNYIGHTYIGHSNYVGHNYIGRTYAGHTYIGNNCIGNNNVGS